MTTLEQLAQRQHCWTYELVAAVRGLPIPDKPEYPLAYHYEAAFDNILRDAGDYLENELRNALERQEPSLPVVPNTGEKDGHRVINAAYGLRFVLMHRDSINATVQAEFEQQQIEAKKSAERHKRVVELNERILVRNLNVDRRNKSGASLLPLHETLYDPSLRDPRIARSWEYIQYPVMFLDIPKELDSILESPHDETADGDLSIKHTIAHANQTKPSQGYLAASVIALRHGFAEKLGAFQTALRRFREQLLEDHDARFANLDRKARPSITAWKENDTRKRGQSRYLYDESDNSVLAIIEKYKPH